MDVNERVNAPVKRIDAKIDRYEDFVRLRAAFGAMASTPKVLANPQQTTSVDFPGQVARVLLSGEESAGQFVIFQLDLQPGFGAPEHHQPDEDEWWFVLEGELDIVIGDQKARVGPGASAYAPRGCTHSFMNNGDRVAKMITMNSPAGHERFFEAVAKLPDLAQDSDRRKLMVDHGVVFHDKVVFD